MTAPKITIQCTEHWANNVSEANFSADWQDDKSRYHVWLWCGTLRADEPIHKNSLADQWLGERPDRRPNPDYRPHQTLNLDAKAHAAVKAAIIAAATPETLQKALDDAKEADRQKAEAERRAAATAIRVKLDAAAAGETMDFPSFAFLCDDISRLSDDDLLRLSAIIRSA